ncbi:MAG: UPF0158 family protein [Armatimonadota bacterium]
MRKLKVDLGDLEIAFVTDQMSGIEHYLDRESGKVLMITEDDRRAADTFFEEAGAEADESELDAKFDEWLDDYDCQDWQEDSIRDAVLIERGGAKRFIHTPHQDSRDGYSDMADFAETVANERMQGLLAVALHGKGAFRRFKDVLYDYPDEQKRFFEFSAQRLKDRMVEWLNDEGIELDS